VAVDVGEAKVAALETIGQALAINAQEMEDRGLEVVHMHRVADDVHAEVVGFAVGEAGQPYQVQANSDPDDWVGITSLTAGPDGHMNVAEPPLAGVEVCFYREIRR
jgi:hypothetical protein